MDQIETAGHRQRLAVDCMDVEREEACLSWTQIELHHAGDVTLRRDLHEIFCRGVFAANFVWAERETEMPLSVAREWVFVLVVWSEARIGRQAHKVFGALIGNDFDTSSGDGR